MTRPVASSAKITMVSTGDGPIGIQKMTQEILGVVKDLPETMTDLTGVDITKVDLFIVALINQRC